MQIQFIEIVRHAVALAAGGLIGLAFGRLQQAALRHHAALEQSGKLKNGWTLMPAAGARVAYFLIALVLVQLVCPVLFTDGTQWWVSAGVILGHGRVLYQQLRQRIS